MKNQKIMVETMKLKEKVIDYFQAYWKNNLFMKSVSVLVTACFILNIFNLSAFADTTYEKMKMLEQKQKVSRYVPEDKKNTVSYVYNLDKNLLVYDGVIYEKKDQQSGQSVQEKFERKINEGTMTEKDRRDLLDYYDAVGNWDGKEAKVMKSNGSMNGVYTGIIKSKLAASGVTASASSENETSVGFIEGTLGKVKDFITSITKGSKGEQEESVVDNKGSGEEQKKESVTEDKESKEESLTEAATQDENAMESEERTEDKHGYDQEMIDALVSKIGQTEQKEQTDQTEQKIIDMLNKAREDSYVTDKKLGIKEGTTFDNTVSLLKDFLVNGVQIVNCAADALSNVLDMTNKGMLAFQALLVDLSTGIFSKINKPGDTQVKVSADALSTVLAKYEENYQGREVDAADINSALKDGGNFVLNVSADGSSAKGDHYITLTSDGKGNISIADINKQTVTVKYEDLGDYLKETYNWTTGIGLTTKTDVGKAVSKDKMQETSGAFIGWFKKKISNGYKKAKSFVTSIPKSVKKTFNSVKQWGRKTYNKYVKPAIHKVSSAVNNFRKNPKAAIDRAVNNVIKNPIIGGAVSKLSTFLKSSPVGNTISAIISPFLPETALTLKKQENQMIVDNINNDPNKCKNTNEKAYVGEDAEIYINGNRMEAPVKLGSIEDPTKFYSALNNKDLKDSNTTFSFSKGRMFFRTSNVNGGKKYAASIVEDSKDGYDTWGKFLKVSKGGKINVDSKGKITGDNIDKKGVSIGDIEKKKDFISEYERARKSGTDIRVGIGDEGINYSGAYIDGYIYAYDIESMTSIDFMSTYKSIQGSDLKIGYTKGLLGQKMLAVNGGNMKSPVPLAYMTPKVIKLYKSIQGSELKIGCGTGENEDSVNIVYVFGDGLSDGHIKVSEINEKDISTFVKDYTIYYNKIKDTDLKLGYSESGGWNINNSKLKGGSLNINMNNIDSYLNKYKVVSKIKGVSNIDLINNNVSVTIRVKDSNGNEEKHTININTQDWDQQKVDSFNKNYDLTKKILEETVTKGKHKFKGLEYTAEGLEITFEDEIKINVNKMEYNRETYDKSYEEQINDKKLIKKIEKAETKSEKRKIIKDAGGIEYLSSMCPEDAANLYMVCGTVSISYDEDGKITNRKFDKKIAEDILFGSEDNAVDLDKKEAGFYAKFYNRVSTGYDNYMNKGDELDVSGFSNEDIKKAMETAYYRSLTFEAAKKQIDKFGMNKINDMVLNRDCGNIEMTTTEKYDFTGSGKEDYVGISVSYQGNVSYVRGDKYLHKVGNGKFAGRINPETGKIEAEKYDTNYQYKWTNVIFDKGSMDAVDPNFSSMPNMPDSSEGKQGKPSSGFPPPIVPEECETYGIFSHDGIGNYKISADDGGYGIVTIIGTGTDHKITDDKGKYRKGVVKSGARAKVKSKIYIDIPKEGTKGERYDITVTGGLYTFNGSNWKGSAGATFKFSTEGSFDKAFKNVKNDLTLKGVKIDKDNALSTSFKASEFENGINSAAFITSLSENGVEIKVTAYNDGKVKADEEKGRYFILSGSRDENGNPVLEATVYFPDKDPNSYGEVELSAADGVTLFDEKGKKVNSIKMKAKNGDKISLAEALNQQYQNNNKNYSATIYDERTGRNIRVIGRTINDIKDKGEVLPDGIDGNEAKLVLADDLGFSFGNNGEVAFNKKGANSEYYLVGGKTVVDFYSINGKHSIIIDSYFSIGYNGTLKLTKSDNGSESNSDDDTSSSKPDKNQPYFIDNGGSKIDLDGEYVLGAGGRFVFTNTDFFNTVSVGKESFEVSLRGAVMAENSLLKVGTTIKDSDGSQTLIHNARVKKDGSFDFYDTSGWELAGETLSGVGDWFQSKILYLGGIFTGDYSASKEAGERAMSKIHHVDMDSRLAAKNMQAFDAAVVAFVAAVAITIATGGLGAAIFIPSMAAISMSAGSIAVSAVISGFFAATAAHSAAVSFQQEGIGSTTAWLNLAAAILAIAVPVKIGGGAAGLTNTAAQTAVNGVKAASALSKMSKIFTVANNARIAIATAATTVDIIQTQTKLGKNDGFLINLARSLSFAGFVGKGTAVSENSFFGKSVFGDFLPGLKWSHLTFGLGYIVAPGMLSQTVSGTLVQTLKNIGTGILNTPKNVFIGANKAWHSSLSLIGRGNTFTNLGNLANASSFTKAIYTWSNIAQNMHRMTFLQIGMNVAGKVFNPLIDKMGNSTVKDIASFIFGEMGQSDNVLEVNMGFSLMFGAVMHAAMPFFGQIASGYLTQTTTAATQSSAAAANTSKASQILNKTKEKLSELANSIYEEGLKENLVQALVTPFVGTQAAEYISEFVFPSGSCGVNTAVNRFTHSVQDVNYRSQSSMQNTAANMQAALNTMGHSDMTVFVGGNKTAGFNMVIMSGFESSLQNALSSQSKGGVNVRVNTTGQIELSAENIEDSGSRNKALNDAKAIIAEMLGIDIGDIEKPITVDNPMIQPYVKAESQVFTDTAEAQDYMLGAFNALGQIEDIYAATQAQVEQIITNNIDTLATVQQEKAPGMFEAFWNGDFRTAADMMESRMAAANVIQKYTVDGRFDTGNFKQRVEEVKTAEELDESLNILTQLMLTQASGLTSNDVFTANDLSIALQTISSIEVMTDTDLNIGMQIAQFGALLAHNGYARADMMDIIADKLADMQTDKFSINTDKQLNELSIYIKMIQQAATTTAKSLDTLFEQIKQETGMIENTSEGNPVIMQISQDLQNALSSDMTQQQEQVKELVNSDSFERLMKEVGRYDKVQLDRIQKLADKIDKGDKLTADDVGTIQDLFVLSATVAISDVLKGQMYDAIIGKVGEVDTKAAKRFEELADKVKDGGSLTEAEEKEISSYEQEYSIPFAPIAAIYGFREGQMAAFEHIVKATMVDRQQPDIKGYCEQLQTAGGKSLIGAFALEFLKSLPDVDLSSKMLTWLTNEDGNADDLRKHAEFIFGEDLGGILTLDQAKIDALQKEEGGLRKAFENASIAIMTYSTWSSLYSSSMATLLAYSSDASQDVKDIAEHNRAILKAAGIELTLTEKNGETKVQFKDSTQAREAIDILLQKGQGLEKTDIPLEKISMMVGDEFDYAYTIPASALASAAGSYSSTSQFVDYYNYLLKAVNNKETLTKEQQEALAAKYGIFGISTEQISADMQLSVPQLEAKLGLYSDISSEIKDLANNGQREISTSERAKLISKYSDDARAATNIVEGSIENVIDAQIESMEMLSVYSQLLNGVEINGKKYTIAGLVAARAVDKGGYGIDKENVVSSKEIESESAFDEQMRDALTEDEMNRGESHATVQMSEVLNPIVDATVGRELATERQETDSQVEKFKSDEEFNKVVDAMCDRIMEQNPGLFNSKTDIKETILTGMSAYEMFALKEAELGTGGYIVDTDPISGKKVVKITNNGKAVDNLNMPGMWAIEMAEGCEDISKPSIETFISSKEAIAAFEWSIGFSGTFSEAVKGIVKDLHFAEIGGTKAGALNLGVTSALVRDQSNIADVIFNTHKGFNEKGVTSVEFILTPNSDITESVVRQQQDKGVPKEQIVSLSVENLDSDLKAFAEDAKNHSNVSYRNAVKEVIGGQDINKMSLQEKLSLMTELLKVKVKAGLATYIVLDVDNGGRGLNFSDMQGAFDSIKELNNVVVQDGVRQQQKIQATLWAVNFEKMDATQYEQALGRFDHRGEKVSRFNDAYYHRDIVQITSVESARENKVIRDAVGGGDYSIDAILKALPDVQYQNEQDKLAKAGNVSMTSQHSATGEKVTPLSSQQAQSIFESYGLSSESAAKTVETIVSLVNEGRDSIGLSELTDKETVAVENYAKFLLMSKSMISDFDPMKFNDYFMSEAAVLSDIISGDINKSLEMIRASGFNTTEQFDRVADAVVRIEAEYPATLQKYRDIISGMNERERALLQSAQEGGKLGIIDNVLLRMTGIFKAGQKLSNLAKDFEETVQNTDLILDRSSGEVKYDKLVRPVQQSVSDLLTQYGQSSAETKDLYVLENFEEIADFVNGANVESKDFTREDIINSLKVLAVSDDLLRVCEIDLTKAELIQFGFMGEKDTITFIIGCEGEKSAIDMLKDKGIVEIRNDVDGSSIWKAKGSKEIREIQEAEPAPGEVREVPLDSIQVTPVDDIESIYSNIHHLLDGELKSLVADSNREITERFLAFLILKKEGVKVEISDEMLDSARQYLRNLENGDEKIITVEEEKNHYYQSANDRLKASLGMVYYVMLESQVERFNIEEPVLNSIWNDIYENAEIITMYRGMANSNYEFQTNALFPNIMAHELMHNITDAHLGGNKSLVNASVAEFASDLAMITFLDQIGLSIPQEWQNDYTEFTSYIKTGALPIEQHYLARGVIGLCMETAVEVGTNIDWDNMMSSVAQNIQNPDFIGILQRDQFIQAFSIIMETYFEIESGTHIIPYNNLTEETTRNLYDMIEYYFNQSSKSKQKPQSQTQIPSLQGIEVEETLETFSNISSNVEQEEIDKEYQTLTQEISKALGISGAGEELLNKIVNGFMKGEDMEKGLMVSLLRFENIEAMKEYIGVEDGMTVGEVMSQAYGKFGESLQAYNANELTKEEFNEETETIRAVMDIIVASLGDKSVADIVNKKGTINEEDIYKLQDKVDRGIKVNKYVVAEAMIRNIKVDNKAVSIGKFEASIKELKEAIERKEPKSTMLLNKNREEILDLLTSGGARGHESFMTPMSIRNARAVSAAA